MLATVGTFGHLTLGLRLINTIMLYNDPKLIFLHVPKTGGSSMRLILQHNLKKKNDDIPRPFGDFDNHHTLQMYHDVGVDLSQYKIVTIARNPWDRILSFYCHHYREYNAFIFPRTLSPLFGMGSRTYVTFPDFYNNISSKHRFIEDFVDWITVDGKIVDNLEIFDFENYEEEVSKLFEEMGFTKRKLPHQRRVSPIPKEFRDYFLFDPAFIERISVEYSKEIKYFNYKAPQLKYTVQKKRKAGSRYLTPLKFMT